MRIGVKRKLAVVTADSDIVGVLWKMSHIFTNAEYVDMLYVYGFCDVNATAAVEEHCRRFPMRRILDRSVFQCVQYIAWTWYASQCSCFIWTGTSTTCGGAGKILEMVQRNLTTSTWRLSTRVWKTEELHPMSSHELQSALMLTVKFSKMYHTR
jgi:hypothetical protein